MHFLAAVASCVLIFLPWQLYIFHAFPREATHEMEYNTRHLFAVVEGHKGDATFYLQSFNRYFGDFIFCLIPAGLQVLLLQKQNHNKLTLSLVLDFLVVFIFFCFIAQTKIEPYFMAVAPLGYIFMAVSLFHLINYRGVYKILYIPVVLTAVLCCFNLPTITFMHDPHNPNSNNCAIDWTTKAENAEIYRDIKNYLPPNVKILLNANDYVDIMFYNNDIDAYGWIVNEEDFEKIKMRHAPVAILKRSGDTSLPDYVRDYDSLHIVHLPLKYQ